MILKNHSLSSVVLFSKTKYFAMPFGYYKYFADSWIFCNNFSEILKTRFYNNRFGKINRIASSNWSKNI